MHDFDAALGAARASLDAEDTQGAFTALVGWFEAPLDPDERQALYQTFGRVAARRYGEPWGPLADAATALDDADAQHAFAHALIERDLPGPAAGVLAEAWRRGLRSADVLVERVAALELLGRNRDALALLREPDAARVNHPLRPYLEAFDATFVGELEAARGLVPWLAEPWQRDRILGILARSAALAGAGLDPSRDRMARLTGGLLLVPEPSSPERGSWTDVRAAVDGLVAALAAWSIAPPLVLPTYDERSRVLGQVIAERLDLPLRPFSGIPEPGLVVVFDLAALRPDVRGSLVAHAAGQVFFALGARRGREWRVAPDLLGFGYDHALTPWQPEEPDLFGDEEEEPDAEGLVAALEGADAGATVSAEVLATLREADPAALRAEGRREPLWTGVLAPG